MSKLIVEMEMPVCCADCPCCICLNGMKPAYCKAIMVDDDNIVDGLMWRETDPNNRPSWCPIKGVLPDEHGDLIDRSALWELMCTYDDYQGAKEAHDLELIHRDSILFAIETAPTVVAAERKDDGTTVD